MAQIIPIGVLGLVTSTAFVEIAPAQIGGEAPVWVTFVTNAIFTVAMMALGMYVGSRRELLWTLRERATRAAQEQALRVAQARTNERGRIADRKSTRLNSSHVAS